MGIRGWHSGTFPCGLCVRINTQPAGASAHLKMVPTSGCTAWLYSWLLSTVSSNTSSNLPEGARREGGRGQQMHVQGGGCFASVVIGRWVLQAPHCPSAPAVLELQIDAGRPPGQQSSTHRNVWRSMYLVRSTLVLGSLTNRHAAWLSHSSTSVSHFSSSWAEWHEQASRFRQPVTTSGDKQPE